MKKSTQKRRAPFQNQYSAQMHSHLCYTIYTQCDYDRLDTMLSMVDDSYKYERMFESNIAQYLALY